jgi:hypothetical protein
MIFVGATLSRNVVGTKRKKFSIRRLGRCLAKEEEKGGRRREEDRERSREEREGGREGFAGRERNTSATAASAAAIPAL